MNTFRSSSTSTPRRYRITQLAFVQEHALGEAQNHIKRLEWEVQRAPAGLAAEVRSPSGGGFSEWPVWRRCLPAAERPASRLRRTEPGSTAGSGILSAIGSSPPQYPPSYQPGISQRQGPGFLSSALTTAAGVAGGVVAGSALISWFPHTRAAWTAVRPVRGRRHRRQVRTTSIPEAGIRGVRPKGRAIRITMFRRAGPIRTKQNPVA